MSFDPGDYAELLGLYLGDGHIAHTGRSYRLRLFLDSKYPLVVNESEAILKRCWPENRVYRLIEYQGRMTTLSVYSKHLPCLFPQHGSGMKHERLITLEDWQQRIVDAQPWRALRGLIRSDGCSFVNRTGPYEYLSFHFLNKSYGVVRVFQGACDNVGLQYRLTFDQRREVWVFRINRRASVALLVENVGVKA